MDYILIYLASRSEAYIFFSFYICILYRVIIMVIPLLNNHKLGSMKSR